ncbi:hypothetical protein NFX46_06855 [Streptomyces phaeoluteigriseus]|uniref:Uncharacterized protein n=1 Tax=Streptomyces phaeoluteigriseus TaxID=114686 RepID=A0ABY4Z3C4_9ACTN|nr:hypothetical protein [Streptomyces phaeoluteigriseus]USQ83534.1 hypothetical protein NFX46_06855 [Streptomyces phaeoluteigriseus]
MATVGATGSCVATVGATGSYVVAGTVLALFGALAVVLMPLRVSLVDRHGPRRALPPMTAPHAVLLGAPADVTWRPGAQPVVLGALAALAGACAPPPGPVMALVTAAVAGTVGRSGGARGTGLSRRRRSRPGRRRRGPP